ncbi:hypothetical protein CFC21_095420 [Triticum aestivum]|uniref:Disease resistance R13L4/SHOC-2-like LRR domain-containing protein n=2 Tax=Triticum aestivum TaxID=4565 RepID=A0A9R1MXF7_WHEAT|nr:hypothetical protein CFC21_095420 [Triticum aestivum]
MTVLGLSGLPIKKIPDDIGHLFNLRHLGLRNSKVKMLPKSIEKLSNLLTLDLHGSDIRELPSWITKLKKLRHLFVEKQFQPYREIQSNNGVRIPNGLGNLTNLQTLEAQATSVRQLGELTQLRSLRLWNVKEIDCRCISDSLVQMRHLSNLYVSASDDNEILLLNLRLPSLQKLSLIGRLVRRTLHKSPLFQAVEGQNLYSLALSWSQLTEDPLPYLSPLSNLTYLQFTRAYTGEKLTFLTGWFPKIKFLHLRDMPNLNRLEIEQGTMVSLERLALVNLESMMEVPLGIKFLMPLQYVGFHEITGYFLMLLHQCSAIRGTQWGYSLRR